MTNVGTTKKPLSLRALQAAALLLVFGLMYASSRALAAPLTGSTMAAVGFLLLSGVLTSELFELLGLPHLTGYLVAGTVAGPHVLHLIHHDTVAVLSHINQLALALIALAGGAELKMSDLRSGMRTLAWSTLTQTTFVLVACFGSFLVAARYLPFLNSLPTRALYGAAILWGVLSLTRSPAALLGVLSQTKAQGPIARFGLTFVMSSDIVVVIVLALAFMVARPLLVPGTEISLSDLGAVFHELLGSIALGTSLGLILIAYLKWVGRALLVVLLLLGFGLTEIVRYLHLDPLLVFILGGLIVQNMSTQGHKLLTAIEQTGSLVYVVFFATAGAHLDIPLLRELWPVALGLAASRICFTWIAHRASSALAKDEPRVRSLGWTPLVSQAGLALGLALVVSSEFPSLGSGFGSLAIAMVAVNEIVGPVLFKWALDRAGESRPPG